MIHLPPKRKIVAPRFGPIQTFGLRGRLRGILHDHQTGEVRRYLNHNIIVRDFLATVPLSFYQARSFYIDEMRVGTGITAPSDTDTSLAVELATKAITDPITTTFLTGATPYSIATVQFGLGEAIGKLTEAAQYDSNGDMANRALFGRGSIEAATTTDPVAIESTAHDLSNGDMVRFDSVGGMTQLNWTTNGNTYYFVSVVDPDNFELFTDAGLTTELDGTGFGAWTSGGVWTQVIDKTGTKTFFASFEMQAENAS